MKHTHFIGAKDGFQIRKPRILIRSTFHLFRRLGNEKYGVSYPNPNYFGGQMKSVVLWPVACCRQAAEEVEEEEARNRRVVRR